MKKLIIILKLLLGTILIEGCMVAVSLYTGAFKVEKIEPSRHSPYKHKYQLRPLNDTLRRWHEPGRKIYWVSDSTYALDDTIILNRYHTRK